MSEDKLRVALEDARSYLTRTHLVVLPEDQESAYCNALHQINDALAALEDIELIKDQAFQAGYQQKEFEIKAHEEFRSDQLQKAVRKAYEDGRSVIRSVNVQPYEIQTDSGVKYSAKGEMQPEASVRITRRLEDDSEISDLIKADLNRGVEEISIAIDAIRKKGAA